MNVGLFTQGSRIMLYSATSFTPDETGHSCTPEETAHPCTPEETGDEAIAGVGFVGVQGLVLYSRGWS